MIIIQDKGLHIIGIGTTLPKAMIDAGIRRVKYDYMRKLLSYSQDKYEVKYKEYYLSKW